ncbi:hypothetical protein CYMTET_29012, partial [Cymbomonas tetramitiformis]
KGNSAPSVQRTSVAYSTLAPTWEEEISLLCYDKSAYLRCEVFDYDVMTADDFMGEAEVALDRFMDPSHSHHQEAIRRQTYTLGSNDKLSKVAVSGSLVLSVTYTPYTHAQLSIEGVEAKGIDTASPVGVKVSTIVISEDTVTKKLPSTKCKNGICTWGSVMTFDFVVEDARSTLLQLELFEDGGVFRSNATAGKCQLSLMELYKSARDGRAETAWYTLSSGKADTTTKEPAQLKLALTVRHLDSTLSYKSLEKLVDVAPAGNGARGSFTRVVSESSIPPKGDADANLRKSKSATPVATSGTAVGVAGMQRMEQSASSLMNAEASNGGYVPTADAEASKRADGSRPGAEASNGADGLRLGAEAPRGADAPRSGAEGAPKEASKGAAGSRVQLWQSGDKRSGFSSSHVTASPDPPQARKASAGQVESFVRRRRAPVVRDLHRQLQTLVERERPHPAPSAPRAASAAKYAAESAAEQRRTWTLAIGWLVVLLAVISVAGSLPWGGQQLSPVPSDDALRQPERRSAAELEADLAKQQAEMEAIREAEAASAFLEQQQRLREKRKAASEMTAQQRPTETADDGRAAGDELAPLVDLEAMEPVEVTSNWSAAYITHLQSEITVLREQVLREEMKVAMAWGVLGPLTLLGPRQDLAASFGTSWDHLLVLLPALVYGLALLGIIYLFKLAFSEPEDSEVPRLKAQEADLRIELDNLQRDAHRLRLELEVSLEREAAPNGGLFCM